MGLWWAYVGSLGGSAGPMFGLCWAKRCRHLGLCSANFNPDLRKIRSGLRKTILFGPCPSHIGPILCQVGACWAYLAAIGTSTAWATRRNFTLYKVKFDMTHVFGLKCGCPATCKYISGLFCLDGQTNKGWKHKTIYIYILYSFIYLFIYLDLYVYINIYKHVLQQWQWISFSGCQTSRGWKTIYQWVSSFLNKILWLKTTQDQTPKMINQPLKKQRLKI